MPIRPIPLVTQEYYHLFNRGVAKLPIFHKPNHYRQFLRTARYYSFMHHPLKYSKFRSRNQQEQIAYLLKQRESQKFVTCIAYCLMSNHYHFLARQEVEGGISSWLGLVSNSYTRYLNTLTNRVGPLFQGPFKAVHIQDDSQLIHLSRYIHRNPLEAGLVDSGELVGYQWSSLRQYTHHAYDKGDFEVEPEIVMEQFKGSDDYQNYLDDSSDYADGVLAHKHALIDAE